MRRGVAIVASLIIVGTLVGNVYAGCGCCAASKKAKAAKKCAAKTKAVTVDAYTSAQLSALNLSSMQKKRIEAAQKTYNSKIESILTKEQKAKLSSACK